MYCKVYLLFGTAKSSLPSKLCRSTVNNRSFLFRGMFSSIPAIIDSLVYKIHLARTERDLRGVEPLAEEAPHRAQF